MSDLGESGQFDEVAHEEYRGYIITISAKELTSLKPELKYQIYQSKEYYIKDIDLYDSSDYFYIKDDYDYIIRQAKEWIDIYETFNCWTN